jgi:putative ABC transport system permease protein
MEPTLVRYFLKALGSHFTTGRSLYFLTVIGVALGVASVLSIQIINRNALAAFSGSVAAVSGEADFSILGRTPSFSESLYPEVLAEQGVAAAWPLYRIDVALIGRDRFFLEVLGVDFFTPVEVPWQERGGDLSDFLSKPGWVAVSPTLAKENGWVKGLAFEVASGSRRVQFRVGALVDFQALTPLASPKLVVMDIAQAQSLLGGSGQIHQIDVRLESGADRSEVMARLETRLGPSVRVMTPEQREHQAEGLLAAFRLNLTAMSLISLFVGLFLIYSSTQASLVRRRAEFGLLRSLGSTRKQVLLVILAEVGLLGTLGVLLGLPLGYWVAEANLEVVNATLTNLYLLEEISSLQLPPWFFGLAAAIGIGGALLGALLPALDMSRRDTRSLLAAFTLHEKMGSVALPLFVLGSGFLGVSVLWYFVWGYRWQHAGFVLGIALLLGLPLLTPFVIQQICGRFRARDFGLSYSLKGLGVRLQTTSFAVASLAIAVSMLIGITLMIGSFRETLQVWVGTSIRADIYIASQSWRGRGSAGVLDAGLVRDLEAHEGVVAVDRLRGFLAYSGEQRIGLAGVVMGLPGGEVRFPLLEGEVNPAFRKVREEGAVFVGETLARNSNLWVGDELPVHTPGGEVRFPIAGVYYDYSTEGGAAVMDLRTMEKYFGPGELNSIALYLEPSRNAEEVVDELKGRFPDAPLQIRSNRRLRDEISRIFEQTFAVTRILQVMSLLIAVCGIALMLLVLAREQVSELALYRALGAKRRQIFGVFVGKGLGMGVLGLGMGLGGGIALAAVLIFVINRAYFGWTIQVYWPWASMIQQCVTILGAAVLASLYPAFRASQVPATELSRDDL